MNLCNDNEYVNMKQTGKGLFNDLLVVLCAVRIQNKGRILVPNFEWGNVTVIKKFEICVINNEYLD